MGRWIQKIKNRPDDQPSKPSKTPFEGFEGIHTGHYQKKADEEATLTEALTNATAKLPITVAEVRDAMSPEDIEDWHHGNISIDTLSAFARCLVQRWEMNQGKVPQNFTEHAICEQCGPIWSWFAGKVLGCPWCWNRVADRPIPRPTSVQCGDCTRFQRIDHPHLGHCAKGQPEAIAGLWDTDQRYCESYLPLPRNPS